MNFMLLKFTHLVVSDNSADGVWMKLRNVAAPQAISLVRCLKWGQWV